MAKPKLEVIGLTFGMLTVLAYAGNSRYRVRCQCGQEQNYPISEMKRGKRKSCGCFRWRFGGPTPHKTGKASSVASLLNDYQSSAKKRNLEFTLTTEQFEKLLFSNCTYCGNPPLNHHNKYIKKDGTPKWKVQEKGIRQERIQQADLKYNGIDRVDNSAGYTSKNTVTACKYCNIAKGQRTAEEFLSWAIRLVNYNGNSSINFISYS